MVYLKVNKILHFLLLYVNMIHLKLFKRILKLCEQDVYDINAITSFDKMTSLHYICQDGKINLLKLFIQFEKDRPNVIDLNIQNFNGMATLLLDEKENNEIDPSLFKEFIYDVTNSGFYSAPGTYNGCPSYRTVLVGPSKSGKTTMLKMKTIIHKMKYEIKKMKTIF